MMPRLASALALRIYSTSSSDSKADPRLLCDNRTRPISQLEWLDVEQYLNVNQRKLTLGRLLHLIPSPTTLITGEPALAETLTLPNTPHVTVSEAYLKLGVMANDMRWRKATENGQLPDAHAVQIYSELGKRADPS